MSLLHSSGYVIVFCRAVLAIMKQHVSGFGIVLIVALAGCSEENSSSGDTALMTQTDDIKAIRQLAADWRSGWLTGDVDLLLSLYTDDPVLMPQDQPAVVGKAAIRPLYEAVLKEYDFQSEGTLKEVVVSGDMGYFWSAYTLTATPKAGGEAIQDTGKTVSIVKRESGGPWRIARLINNSDGVITGEDRRQEGESDDPSNGGLSVRSQTDQTSAAAGSFR